MTGADDVGILRFYVAVGFNIRAARLNAGLNQEELAKRIGVTRSSIANFETGRQRIALHLFVLISRVLEANLEELLPKRTGSDSPNFVDLGQDLSDSPESAQDFVREAVARLGIESDVEGQ